MSKRADWPPHVIAEYRLTLRARADLLNIFVESDKMFGRYQAEAYHAGFERTFSLLADFPKIGVTADELVAGYRRFRFQSHLVYYTVEHDDVLVRAIIHARQQLRPALFE